MRDYDDGAKSMRHTVLAHRAEKEPSKVTMASRADYEEVGRLGRGQ